MPVHTCKSRYALSSRTTKELRVLGQSAIIREYSELTRRVLDIGKVIRQLDRLRSAGVIFTTVHAKNEDMINIGKSYIVYLVKGKKVYFYFLMFKSKLFHKIRKKRNGQNRKY